MKLPNYQNDCSVHFLHPLTFIQCVPLCAPHPSPLVSIVSRIQGLMTLCYSYCYSFLLVSFHSDVKKHYIFPDLIDRVSKVGILTPNSTWQQHTYNGPAATLVYKLRLVCDRHYYGPSCTVYCKPRSDRYGHNTCDSNGNRVCLPGWSGPYCNIR